MKPDSLIPIEACSRSPSSPPAVRIAVKVVPGAKREKIAGAHGGALKVMVAQPPEGGKANDAVCRLLGKLFGLPIRQVEIVQGQSNPWKTVRLEGLSPEEARRRLAGL